MGELIGKNEKSAFNTTILFCFVHCFAQKKLLDGTEITLLAIHHFYYELRNENQNFEDFFVCFFSQLPRESMKVIVLSLCLVLERENFNSCTEYYLNFLSQYEK